MWSCWGEAISSGLGVACICQYQDKVEDRKRFRVVQATPDKLQKQLFGYDIS